jgi:integrase/recombinase XerD
VMSSQETSAFLKSINTTHVVGLRDRALIGVMVYAFARVSAVVSLKVEDYFPLQKRWWLRLREKGGKVNEMGCHHKLEQYLDEYIAAAGIAEDKKGPLFRAAIGRTGKLSERSMSRVDAWYMVRRRARDAGIETAIGNILSGPSASRTIWNAAATLTSPSGWQVTRTSKRRNSTTGAATK